MAGSLQVTCGEPKQSFALRRKIISSRCRGSKTQFTRDTIFFQLYLLGKKQKAMVSYDLNLLFLVVRCGSSMALLLDSALAKESAAG
jgi:hypothetical protein